MNPYSKRYLRQAKAFFPVMGRPERAWLERLAHSIEDYFSEDGPASFDAICQAFGPPQTVVQRYLAEIDTRQVVRRSGMRRFVRRCILGALTAILLVTVALTATWALKIEAYNQVDGYQRPTYSEDGNLVENE